MLDGALYLVCCISLLMLQVFVVVVLLFYNCLLNVFDKGVMLQNEHFTSFPECVCHAVHILLA